MSLSTTIYFASISDFIRWPSFGLSILFMVFFIITWCSRLRSEIIWGTLALTLPELEKVVKEALLAHSESKMKDMVRNSKAIRLQPTTRRVDGGFGDEPTYVFDGLQVTLTYEETRPLHA